MLNQQDAKARARILKTFLAEHGVNLSHGLMLEAVARMEHHKNWATFVAASTTEAALVKTAPQLAGWPLRVFFFDEDDALHVLPEGASFADAARYDDWSLFQDTDAVRAPETFVFGPQVAIQAVLAELPDVEQYGLPDSANDAVAAQWLRTRYGVAVTNTLDVTVHDRGDDGATRIWFEARVEPRYAAQLPKESATNAESSEERAWGKTFAKVFAKPVDPEAEGVRQVLARALEAGDLSAGPAQQQLRHLVLTRLERASRTVHTRGVAAEAYLRKALQTDIELARGFNRLTCAELYRKMKSLAQAAWEQDAVSEKG